LARTLIQKTPLRRLIFKRVRTTKPVVALTFDDGPHPEFTPLVLDILRDHGAHATFFLIGNSARANPEVVKRIVAEGHALGCHTDTHADLSQLSVRAAMRECRSSKQSIEQISGRKVRYLRPPWGKVSLSTVPVSLLCGMRIALWNLDSLDSRKLEPDALVKQIQSSDPQPGDVLLFHDDWGTSVEALPEILQELKGRGLCGCAIEEMVGSSHQ
jgi:peptidoglycan/xylan/chitin deacetylase (PgdA/CDA1 family)